MAVGVAASCLHRCIAARSALSAHLTVAEVFYGAEDTRLSWLTFPYILHTNLTLTVAYILGLRTLCPEQAYDS